MSSPYIDSKILKQPLKCLKYVFCGLDRHAPNCPEYVKSKSLKNIDSIKLSREQSTIFIFDERIVLTLQCSVYDRVTIDSTRENAAETSVISKIYGEIQSQFVEGENYSYLYTSSVKDLVVEILDSVLGTKKKVRDILKDWEVSMCLILWSYHVRLLSYVYVYKCMCTCFLPVCGRICMYTHSLI
jgi:hypothetical protein